LFPLFTGDTSLGIFLALFGLLGYRELVIRREISTPPIPFHLSIMTPRTEHKCKMPSIMWKYCRERPSSKKTLLLQEVSTGFKIAGGIWNFSLK
jgi:hypothetical protein